MVYLSVSLQKVLVGGCLTFSLLCALGHGGQGFAQTQAQPIQWDKPALQQLAQDALRNGSQKDLLEQYTHLQKIITRKIKKDGKVEEHSTLKEAFIPAGSKKGQKINWVYILVEIDGKPVPADKLEKERLKAGEKLLKAETEAQRQTVNQKALDANSVTNPREENDSFNATAPAKGLYFSISTGNMFSKLSFNVRGLLRECEFSNPRQVTLNGRATVQVDFQLRSDAQFESDELYQKQLKGQAWIDLQDRVLVKLLGWPQLLGTSAEKPCVEYESLLTVDGYWLPRVIATYYGSRRDFFKKDYSDVIVEFSRYERFGSEVKDVQLAAPEKSKP